MDKAAVERSAACRRDETIDCMHPGLEARRNDRYIQVMTTLAEKGAADKIARLVVERRLAACAQVAGPVSSTYWWRGEVETASEWLCLMKTERALYEQLESAIKDAHRYETPEIIAIPIEAGSEAYLAWLSREMRAAGNGT
jgi:periplasmic divalent cation tolerance protein